MKVVHILGHYCNIKILLKLRNDFMCPVWLYCLQLGSSFIVKAEHKFLVFVPPVNRSYLLDRVVFPQPVTIPEGLYSTLLTYTCTVPANTTATLRLPAPTSGDVREGDGLAKNAYGVTYAGIDGECVVYELESGSYTFTLQIK